MTGNLAFETVVALAANIDCGCQSRSFISRIDSETCACAGASPKVACTRNTSNDANAMRVMGVLRGVSCGQFAQGTRALAGRRSSCRSYFVDHLTAILWGSQGDWPAAKLGMSVHFSEAGAVLFYL